MSPILVHSVGCSYGGKLVGRNGSALDCNHRGETGLPALCNKDHLSTLNMYNVVRTNSSSQVHVHYM